MARKKSKTEKIAETVDPAFTRATNSRLLAKLPDPQEFKVKDIVPDIEKDPTRTSTLRNQLTTKARRLFRDLQAMILAVLKSNDDLFRNNPYVSEMEARKSQVEEMQTPADRINLQLTDVQRTAQTQRVRDIFGDLIERATQRGYQRGGSEQRAIGIQAPVLPARPVVPRQDMIAETLVSVTTDMITSLQQRYLAEVRQTIQFGLLQGTDRRDLEREIVDLTGNYTWQAERIVRTEVIRAYNTALRNRLQGDGTLFWQWIASNERTRPTGTRKAGRTCEVCYSLHGMVVEIGKPFMIHKGQAITQPPAHPNCRCTVRPATRQEQKRRTLSLDKRQLKELLDKLKQLPGYDNLKVKIRKLEEMDMNEETINAVYRALQDENFPDNLEDMEEESRQVLADFSKNLESQSFEDLNFSRRVAEQEGKTGSAMLLVGEMINRLKGELNRLGEAIQ